MVEAIINITDKKKYYKNIKSVINIAESITNTAESIINMIESVIRIFKVF